MSTDPQEQSNSETTDERKSSPRKRDLIDWLDAIAKFLTPAVLFIATLIAARLGNDIQRQIAEVTTSSQERISGTTLLSEREKAESQLRADMFSSLIGPIAGDQKSGLSVEREQLLVELLALNFHEHFEVKPLFERVDKHLAIRGMQGARQSLRSIARRIIDRQIAMLQKEENTQSPAEMGAKVYSFAIVEPNEPKALNQEQQQYMDGLKQTDGKVYEVYDEIQGLISPDGNYNVTMVISDADWEKHEFKARIYLCPGTVHKCSPVEGEPTKMDISPTWSDLPLTDNTLFPNGNRFAVVVYRVSRPPDVMLSTARLKFIWFPKDYYTPRERPLDSKKFLELVGKKS